MFIPQQLRGGPLEKWWRRGGAKAKKKSQEIINENKIFLRIMPKKKKKDLHLTCMYKKKILHLLKSPPSHHFSNGPSLKEPITYFPLVS